MDVAILTELVSNVGFPIAMAIGMGWFIYQIFKKTTDENAKNMEKVQSRCKEREEKLYEEIKQNREINAQAIATITLYAEKLDVIQTDIGEIKTSMAVLTASK